MGDFGPKGSGLIGLSEAEEFHGLPAVCKRRASEIMESGQEGLGWESYTTMARRSKEWQYQGIKASFEY